MGFFIRPKDTNRVSTDDTSKLNAEATAPSNEGFEDEYTNQTGVASHHQDPIRREAAPSAPLPSGSWRGAVSKNVPSGFGRGSRSGKSGSRKG